MRRKEILTPYPLASMQNIISVDLQPFASISITIKNVTKVKIPLDPSLYDPCNHGGGTLIPTCQNCNAIKAWYRYHNFKH